MIIPSLQILQNVAVNAALTTQRSASTASAIRKQSAEKRVAKEVRPIEIKQTYKRDIEMGAIRKYFPELFSDEKWEDISIMLKLEATDMLEKYPEDLKAIYNKLISSPAEYAFFFFQDFKWGAFQDALSIVDASNEGSLSHKFRSVISKSV